MSEAADTSRVDLMDIFELLSDVVFLMLLAAHHEGLRRLGPAGPSTWCSRWEKHFISAYGKPSQILRDGAAARFVG